MQNNVAANIRAELARRGRTQSDLARHLGIAQQGLSNRLRGITALSVDELQRCADFLGIPAAALLDDAVARA